VRGAAGWWAPEPAAGACLVFVFVLLAMVLGMIGYRCCASPALPGLRSIQSQPQPRGARRTAWKGAVGSSLGRWSTLQVPVKMPTTNRSHRSSSGEYLGEWASDSETIGASEPDQVTAFEVWLFDKSDIRTVTRC